MMTTFRLGKDIDCAALSPDGRTIAVINKERALLFSAPLQRLFFKLPSNMFEKINLEFSPKGDALFTIQKPSSLDRDTVWWAAPRGD